MDRGKIGGRSAKCFILSAYGFCCIRKHVVVIFKIALHFFLLGKAIHEHTKKKI